MTSRIQIKYFLENPEAVALTPFMGVFQRWIQQQALEGLLIDAADYGHVHDGPGIVLIGHEGDYAIDASRGRLGLLHTQKRSSESDLQPRLQGAFRMALKACHLLESEAALKLKFRTDEAEIRFADRLQFPNQPEAFERVKSDIQAVLTALYG